MRFSNVDDKKTDESFDDPIESTGCNAENEAVILCFDRTKDWRDCVKELKAFKDCFENYQKNREKQIVEKLQKQLDDMADRIKNAPIDIEFHDAPGSEDHVSPIPGSSEQ